MFMYVLLYTMNGTQTARKRHRDSATLARSVLQQMERHVWIGITTYQVVK